ncbi:MAG: hypothetical protein Q7J48_12115 [Nocardioides sp.]|nr:hypothetical protein [Nocardioides sp.]
MEYTDYDTRLAAYAVVVDDDERVLLALWNEEHERRWTLHRTADEGGAGRVRGDGGRR